MKKLVFNIGFSVLLYYNSVFAEGETPLIVNDPELHAGQATVIGKMVDSIKKYEEIISKAQAQINQLQKVNNMINTTNSLISGSAITLANPMQVIQNAQYQIESIKYNYENLKQSIENWNARDLLRNKYLQQQCPFFDFNKLTNNEIVNLSNLNNAITKTGKQTAQVKDMQNLIQALSNNGYENLQSLAGQLSGRDMGLILCEQLIKDENQARYNQLSAEASFDILNGNYQAYKMKIFQQDAMKLTERIKKQKEINAKADYLKHRLTDIQQQLGVTDSTANHNKQGIHYCKENKENGTCTPLALEKTRLDNELDLEIQTLTQDLSKAPNKDAQSQAYANFNQRIRLLTIKYLKEITNQMLFLNQTMAMQSEIIADIYKTDYGFNTNLKGAKSTQYQTREQILGKVKTNQFGFPEIAPN
ncbi:hypothetical protein BB415_00225 [Helicobacter pylori]|uniref:hypothetical protein n=1 Tax=Helicobacter pylori TaxID=210 RepID=UPI00099204EE|nr:hypothetical protein [Helicobacter pylori]OOP85927.1 hypothetical protein B0X24_02440 [Helicobacter pylori]PDX20273.1 hypothetical protein BB415_00225 [Helicobacter pylori]